MVNKKVRTRATASGVTDGMRPRIANCNNENDDNDDNVDNADNDENENYFVTASGATDDHLSDLTTPVREDFAYPNPKNISLTRNAKRTHISQTRKKGTSPKRDEPLPLGHCWTF